MSTFQWTPSVPVNRDEVGGNVLLNNGALPLGTTHLALASPHIKRKKRVMMWPLGCAQQTGKLTPTAEESRCEISCLQ